MKVAYKTNDMAFQHIPLLSTTGGLEVHAKKSHVPPASLLILYLLKFKNWKKILIIRILIVRNKCINAKLSFTIYTNVTEIEENKREAFWQNKTFQIGKRRW